nr:retrovirus-related Pol polyprotein from transposon TNT 1-94 [Tanacetum cinerariifolium]
VQKDRIRYNQQEGIDYDETYAPVARLKSIRILLAYACALDFKLFQMYVKSAFLNGFINEEYVAQPPGFIDFKKPNHAYKSKKALYGLKQAPKAWYGRLKAFLNKHEYKMGMVDNTLFTKKKSSNLIIVQIYVDDIIFDSTCQDMYDEFAKIMHDEFEMSMMGELNFFFGFQIKQMKDGIFINQSKYIKEMLKKFGLEDSKPIKTPMSSDTKLTKDKECESIDSTKYRGMIGLWYHKGTGIETVVYADSDHAGVYVDRKSTSGIYTTTTHSDISLSEYDSFIFEEFVDELAHIISPPEYDCFYFKDLPDQGELMSVLNFRIRENLSTTLVNLPIKDVHSPFLAYVVWIFVSYLTYPVIPPYLYPFGNEDTIFDPGITINHFYSSKPGLSHRHGAFKKINTHHSHLNEWSMIINGKNTPILDVLLFYFYPP